MKYGTNSKYIHYSQSSDKLFCLACSMFDNSKVQYRPTKWIKGFDNWKKLNDSKQGLPHHFDSNAHKECIIHCESFIVSMSDDLAKVIKLGFKMESKQVEDNSAVWQAWHSPTRTQRAV